MRWIRKATEVVALLVCASCAAAPPPPPAETPPPVQPPVARLRPRLSGADLDTIAEIIRLEDRREFDPARFAVWLRHPHEDMRARAAIGAGRILDHRATPLLLATLNDSSQVVRADVAFAIGELNDTSAAVFNALTELSSRAAPDGIEAIAALGRLDAVRATTTLERIIADANANAELRKEALMAIWRVPRSANKLELLLPLTTSLDADMRWRAVYVLTRAGSDWRALPNFIRLMNDTDPLVRALATRGLRAVAADSANARADAMAALRRALADTHPHVRINAVRMLGQYRSSENADAIAALLRDPDGNVGIAAAEALGENGAATAALAEAARTHPSLGVRNAALTALARPAQQREQALSLAREWLARENPIERLYAVRLLAANRDTTYRTAVNDANPLVAAAALNAIATADTASPPYALFIEKLAHRDPGVRAAAVRGLSRRATASDLELFLRAYGRAQQDTQRFAAEAAVDALGALGRKGVPVQRSFFLQFQRPNDPLLLQRIVNQIGPGDWAPVRPIDTGKSTSFYRAVARRFYHSDSTGLVKVRMRTAAGEFVMELNGRAAPLVVSSFLTLTERGFFNNGRWHRVVPFFVAQDGDPRGDGSGGAGIVLRDEINRLRYTRAAVGTAHGGADTNGTQWFITHIPIPHLDGGYTVFGYVVSGMDVVDRIVQDDAIHSIEIVR